MTDSRFQRAAVVVAAVAALHGLVYVPLVDRHATTDTDTYVATAHAIADASYSTPLRAGFYFTYPVGFFDLTGVHFPRSPLWEAPEKQAFRTPGYPLLLAAIGGGGPGFPRYVALVVQALLLGLATWLLALTARRWWGPLPALGAAILYALDPYSKHYVTLVVTETLATVVLVATAYAFTRAWDERSTAWWAAAGAGAAALTLVRPAFALAVPLIVVAAAFARGRRLRNAAATAAAALVLLVPWLAWTNHAVGTPVLTAWGEGFNLLLAAHGEGLGNGAAEIERDPAFLADLEASRRTAPPEGELARDPYAHPRYLRRADVDLRARARTLYGDRLRDEPGQVAWENVYRNYFLWTAHHDWYQPDGLALAALKLVDWLLLVLAAAGLVLAWSRSRASFLVGLFLLAYGITLATHHVEARFAMPLRGFLLAYVALAVMTAWAYLAERRAGARRSTAAPSAGFPPT
jgi:4-amino-4-deoxy-L-arabinose transferase-like glycosyltransferase